MNGLIPLLIALTVVETSVHPGQAELLHVRPLGQLLAIIGIGAGFWLLLCETVGRLLAGRVVRRTLNQWDALAQGLALGAFALLCYDLQWPTRAGWYSLALAPWALFQAIHWWCLALPLGRATGVPWERNALVWHQVRFSLMPLGIAMPVMDLCTWFARSTGMETWMFSHLGLWVNVIGGALLALGLVALLPWLLVRAWGARRLDDPVVHGELTDLCHRAGVRVGGLMRWPVRGGKVYNAMVLGVLPRLRYVLFTDDLLRDFPPRERVAVLGHELGHARHYHLWIYLLFALATGLASLAARGVLGDALAAVPALADTNPDVREGLIALALLAVQWRLLFGVLSRACERQADLTGAELAGDGDLPHGARIMQEALDSLGRLAGIDPRSPSWRHYSLEERIAWLGEVARDPAVARRHHRLVRIIVRVIAGAAGVLIALAVTSIH